MNSQTTRRPENKRPQTPAPGSRRYSRQTAHVEARRDGQPLIFGWGGHLTRTHKTQIQRIAVWTFIGLIIVAIFAVFVGFWVNFNIVIPNEPIASVNGQNIPQSDYHKLVAFHGQDVDNGIKGKNGVRAQESQAQQKSNAQQKIITSTTTQIDNLNKQIKALPANSSQLAGLQAQLKTAQQQQTAAQNLKKQYDNQYTNLSQQDQLVEANYTQSQIGNDSAEWLQDDVVIRNWLNKQSSTLQNKINPTSSQVSQGMNTFKAQLPTGETYSQFLNSSNVSDSDMHAMMTLILRRQNMQNYLATLITSPARQVDARSITVATNKDAQSLLTQLHNGTDFATLAKNKSLDNNTKQKGGELGWLAEGQYFQNQANSLNDVVDKWLSDPSRKPGDISPALNSNGDYDILQIEQVDPSRAISATTLSALQNNALRHWIMLQQASGVKYGAIDQNKLLDPSNVPSWIPSSPPNATPTATGAQPG